MGRIYSDITINGEELYTLFDSGSENNYITEEAVNRAGLQSISLPKVFHVGIGGETRTIIKGVSVFGEIDGNPFFIHAFVISGLGIDRRTGKKIEFLFGAHEIQRWNIKLDMKNEKLDLSKFTKEFIEYL